MGLFKRKKTQSELITERLQAMKADEKQTFADFYRAEMGQEEEIRKKIANPPPGIWKKGRYKNKKNAELAELMEEHNSLFYREAMDAAQNSGAYVNQQLDKKKGKKEQANTAEIEEVFDSLALYDASELVNEVSMMLLPTQRYKSLKNALKACKDKKKTALDKMTKEAVKASLSTILGANVEFDQGMEFLKKKHPSLRRLLCYRALLEGLEQELGTMIRQPGADLRALRKGEYAKLYGQRLAVDTLVARAMLQQGNLQQEYQKYQQTGAEEEIEAVQEENEQKEKIETPDQRIYNRMGSVNLLDHINIPQNSRAEVFAGIYRKLSGYLEAKINGWGLNFGEQLNEICKQLKSYGLFKKMGAVTNITTFSLSLIDKPALGVEFLKDKDESLLLEYAVQAVAERLGQEMETMAEGDKKAAQKVKEKAEKLKQELCTDEVNKERIEKVKTDFKTVRLKGIEEISQKYPECFAYYEFMNGEVVKSIQFQSGKRTEKGLFDVKDFQIFDSNKTEELEDYLKYYEDEYLKKEDHDPMYDEIYGHLKKHIEYRINVINKLKKFREDGPDQEYKKGKTCEVNEKKGNYLLKGYETPVQNTGQGCWSVAMAAMLQYRGYQVSQTDIRSYRSETDTSINYVFSYSQNMNYACNIADHTNLLVELAPDTMMKQVSFMTLPGKTELKKKIKDLAKEAIGRGHGPLAVLFRGHYRVIYGCQGENVIMHDPLKKAAETLTLDSLVTQMQGLKDVSFYWLEDLPEKNQNGERVLETENKEIDIHYTEDGDLEYQKVDEIVDPEVSIVRSGYTQLCTGGTMATHLDYVFLPGRKKNKVQ